MTTGTLSMNKHPLLPDDDTTDAHLLIEVRRHLFDAIINCAGIRNDQLRQPFLTKIGNIIQEIDTHV